MQELHIKFSNLGKKDVILDVRSQDEYREGHVPGSRNISYDEVDKFISELKGFDKVYIHCRSGGRAKAAFEILQKKGLTNLVCVAGSGMADWIEAGFEVEK